MDGLDLDLWKEEIPPATVVLVYVSLQSSY